MERLKLLVIPARALLLAVIALLFSSGCAEDVEEEVSAAPDEGAWQGTWEITRTVDGVSLNQLIQNSFRDAGLKASFRHRLTFDGERTYTLWMRFDLFEAEGMRLPPETYVEGTATGLYAVQGSSYSFPSREGRAADVNVQPSKAFQALGLDGDSLILDTTLSLLWSSGSWARKGDTLMLTEQWGGQLAFKRI